MKTKIAREHKESVRERNAQRSVESCQIREILRLLLGDRALLADTRRDLTMLEETLGAQIKNRLLLLVSEHHDRALVETCLLP